MRDSPALPLNKTCTVVGVGEGIVAALMLARDSGSILITGATAGIRPWPTSAGFAPAKFAVRGLAQVGNR